MCVVLQDPEYDAVTSGQAGGSVDVPDLMEESSLRRGGGEALPVRFSGRSRPLQREYQVG